MSRPKNRNMTTEMARMERVRLTPVSHHMVNTVNRRHPDRSNSWRRHCYHPPVTSWLILEPNLVISPMIYKSLLMSSIPFDMSWCMSILSVDPNDSCWRRGQVKIAPYRPLDTVHLDTDLKSMADTFQIDLTPIGVTSCHREPGMRSMAHILPTWTPRMMVGIESIHYSSSSCGQNSTSPRGNNRHNYRSRCWELI